MADFKIAKIVYRVGRQKQVSNKVMLAAFETGLVESGMRNLDYGDRDSLGVFQQRPSQGWGTKKQIMNPAYAAGKFFEVAKKKNRENPSLSAGQLAQKVQRSAYPDRYDQREAEAKTLLARARQAVNGDGGGDRDKDRDGGGGTLKVDGELGPQTYAALQAALKRHGASLEVDGKFGPLTKKALQAHLGVTQDGVIGPITIKALQQRIGAIVDGNWGPDTTRYLQQALNNGAL